MAKTSSDKPKLWINEDWIEVHDDGKRYGSGESGVYETWATDPGKLYRFLQCEYGRCTGAVYHDIDGQSIKIGWIFEKRRKFDDCLAAAGRHDADELWDGLVGTPGGVLAALDAAAAAP